MKELKQMSNKTKLYIAAVLAVIILISLAVLIPRYNRYLNNKRAAEVRTAMEAVRLSVDDHWKERGSISGISNQDVLETAKLSRKIRDNWEFVIAWKNTEIYTSEMVDKIRDVSNNQTVFVAPYRMIMAVAKAGNPVGEGRKIWFLGDSNSFHGFGVDDKVEPDWMMIFPNP